MASTITTDPVQASYTRCCRPAFFEEFYSTLMNSSPAVKAMFVKTDMEKQKKLLRDGLSFLLMFSRGSSVGRNKVEALAKTHTRTALNVKPEYYGLWVDSLLKTVAKFDPEFTPALNSQWRAALEAGIAVMKAAY